MEISDRLIFIKYLNIQRKLCLLLLLMLYCWKYRNVLVRNKLIDSPGSYKYPMVRGSGAFLVCLGFGIIIGALWPGPSPVNIVIFVIAVALGIIMIPIARRISPLGRPSGTHIGAMIGAVAMELVIFWAVFSR